MRVNESLDALTTFFNEDGRVFDTIFQLDKTEFCPTITEIELKTMP
jgi:hypothetical protein